MTGKPKSENQRTPQAFRLDGDAPKSPRNKSIPKVEFTVDPEPTPLTHSAISLAKAQNKKRGLRWGHILIVTVLALISMWFGLWINTTIASFFAWSLTLGWISVALATAAGLATLAILGREIWGLLRLRRIEHLQTAAANAINHNDADAAKVLTQGLKSLYQKRPELKRAMLEWNEHDGDIIDPPAATRLAERYLLDPLDAAAHAIISRRAKRVTLLSTVTPTAALDIILVGGQNIFMIREIASLYGGRPSFFATLKLARMVLTHLAVTAGLALSENALHLFLGKGLLGRISARLGEGAINGILTARIGLAASDVCRPIPSTASKRENLGALVKEISGWSSEASR